MVTRVEALLVHDGLGGDCASVALFVGGGGGGSSGTARANDKFGGDDGILVRRVDTMVNRTGPPRMQKADP